MSTANHANHNEHNNKALKKLGAWALGSLLLCQAIAAQAKVFVIDTPEAMVYAYNASAKWPLEKDKREEILNSLANKKFNYAYKLNGQTIYGSPNLLNSRTENELTPLIEDSLVAKGMTNSRTDSFSVWLGKDPLAPTPTEMAAIITAQDALYKLSVIKQGNPDTLEERIANRKVAGNVLGVLSAIAGMVLMGPSAGFNAMTNSGISQDIATSIPAGLTKETFGAVTGYPSNINWAQYKAIDFYPGSTQVVIAYKKEKTPQIHDRSLAIAINRMLDISKEDLLSYWQEDFANRQKIWADCKAAGDAICQE